jgi:hypothetical protein
MPLRFTPLRFTPLRCMPLRFTPLRCMPLRFTPLRCMPLRFAPLRFAYSCLALLLVQSLLAQLLLTLLLLPLHLPLATRRFLIRLGYAVRICGEYQNEQEADAGAIAAASA